MEKVIAKHLNLRDVVDLGFTPWGNATVVDINRGMVKFYRPYVHTDDIKTTGGVLHYLGHEYFEVPQDDREFTVIERRPIR